MVYSRCSLLEAPLALDTASTLRAMEFGFWTSLLRVLLLCRVANSALFPDGVYRTECHDRYFMIAMDLSFTGQQFYFEAVGGTGVFPITEQYAAQCGYTVTILHVPGLVELRASYFSCHTTNQNDNTFTFKFNLVLNQTGQVIPYELNETCSPHPWSPREVTCEVNYLEVSVHSDVVCPLGPKPNVWDTSMEMVYGSSSPGWQVVFLNQAGERKPMNLTEAHLNGYALTMTENRMVLRAAYGQQHSFITMIDGFSVEVIHAILFTRQDWLVLLVDLVAACTMYESLDNNEGYMIWETPQTLYPGLRTTNFSFGLNGELWEPTVATDNGYDLNESNTRVKIGIPYNAEGTYRMSLVDGDLYDLYTCHFYMEQMSSSNGGSETRVRTYRKLSSPLIKSSLFTENRTVPDEQMFTVYLGNVPEDAELVSMQLKDKEFKGPFVNSSFYTLDIDVNPNYTYAYTLKVPFDSPFVIRKFSAENEATENKLNVVFTVFVRPQNEPYSHHTTVTALTSVPSPKFNASCSKTGIIFKLYHQPSDFLWDITVGSELLTSELAAKRGYILSNDSHMLQLDVPLFTQGYEYENISLKGFVGTFETLVRDHKTFEIQSSSVKTCVFTTKEIVVCSKDGRMTVVADLSKVLETGGGLNRTTLLDESCAPEEAEEKRARFDFPLNSCDTRVKLNKDFLIYENEILFSLNSTTLSSSILVQCSYPLIGLYSLFTKYQFHSEIAGFGNIVHPSIFTGLPIPITSPTTRPTRRTSTIINHTPKRSKNRLGYKSPIHYIKVSRRFKNIQRRGQYLNGAFTHVKCV